jgi:hypothetical protein
MRNLLLYVIVALAIHVPGSWAGEADVLDASVSKGPGNTYRFDVTVAHADTGWDHYADKWDILDEAGNVLGTRILYHPHVDEQPFTRSLSGVTIPESIRRVTIRAHDSVHGYGGRDFALELP